MNANLVSLLSWTRPYKSGIALLSVNIIFWFLTHQRPICVMSLAALCYYLRYLWKHRIRPEVLVDPPDNEDWVTLSSYDFEQQYITFMKKAWSMWINLRTENHMMFCSVTCIMWIFLAKLGSQVDFVTLLFVISNAAFLLIPLLKFCPAIELPSDDGVIKEEDLIPEVPTKSTTSTKPSKGKGSRQSSEQTDLPKSSSTKSVDVELTKAPHPVQIPESSPKPRRMSPTLSTDLTEGMLTRSMAAAAATFVTSGLSSSSSMMSASAAVISSLVSQASSQLTTASAEPSPEREFMPSASQLAEALALSTSSGPDSLTPGVTAMPDHDQDSDPEDEFLFDAKHFDKSSSSSTSNSFEIINNI